MPPWSLPRVPRLLVGLRGVGNVLRFEGGAAFAVPRGVGRPYALLPLEPTSEVWRIVHASGGRSREHQFRVDYTDDRVRARIMVGQGDRSLVVGAPRSRESVAPVSFVHPGTEMLTGAMRSGVRLRAAGPVSGLLHGAFDKGHLPIVLSPFHHEGLVPRAVRHGLIEMRAGAEAGGVRAVSSAGPRLPFGPAEGCKVKADGVVCTGGASDVIGEVSTAPW